MPLKRCLADLQLRDGFICRFHSDLKLPDVLLYVGNVVLDYSNPGFHRVLVDLVFRIKFSGFVPAHVPPDSRNVVPPLSASICAAQVIVYKYVCTNQAGCIEKRTLCAAGILIRFHRE